MILHAGPSGEPAPAIICRGAGSFEATLRDLGEPLTAEDPAESGGEEEGLAGEGGCGEPQAATVS